MNECNSSAETLTFARLFSIAAASASASSMLIFANLIHMGKEKIDC